MSSESDRLLIQDIRNGDPGAWERLIARYEGRLLAFARQRLHDKDNADDVVQETFVGFITSLPNFDDRRELQTYLFTICAHKITDVLRRSSRRPHHTGTSESDDLLANQLDVHQRTASSAARSQEQRDLESTAIARGLGQIIRRWQADAEYERLKVLELLLVRGMANRDVAKFLRISEQQVANIRFAAMKKLADHVRAAGLPADIFPELQELEEK
jgi:RNA polymerase sigma-70 factor, ECF subfamily